MRSVSAEQARAWDGGAFPLFGPTSNEDAWTEVLSHGFPLRITMRGPSGALLVEIEATRITRKSEPESDFRVPAGYTKTPTPASAAPTSGGSTH